MLEGTGLGRRVGGSHALHRKPFCAFGAEETVNSVVVCLKLKVDLEI